MSDKIPTMLTIDETAAKSNLLRHFIRQLVLDNKIIHIKAGRKYLINYEKFVIYLNTGEPTQPEPLGKIRRLY